MSAEQALVAILQSRVPTSFVLRGPWGRGKTHLWKKLVTETRPVHWDVYSYVSLFGLNSIDELKTAIFESACAPHQAHPEPVALSLDTPVGDVQKELKRNWRAMLKSAAKLDIPTVGNVAPLFQSLAFYGVRRRLICLDDIERRGDGLALKDVLGFVSVLCEERHCAVVVITNDGALDEEDQTIWNRYREKVFRGEVFFDPEPSRCIELVLPEDWQDDPWLRGLGKALKDIGVSNIRIIMRAKRTVEALRDRLQGVSIDVALEIGRSVGCIVYFRCGNGEGAPPLERAMQRAYLPEALGQQDERTEEQRYWDDVLSDLNFRPNSIDRAVCDFVCNGFLDAERLGRQVDLFEQQLKLKAEALKWDRACNAYLNNFRVQKAELVELFQDSLPYACAHLSAKDLDSTIVLLRRIGADVLAKRFISGWVAAQREAGRKNSLDEAGAALGIKDPEFKLAIAKARQAAASVLSLAEVFSALSRQVDTEYAFAQLAVTDAAEVGRYISENSGHGVRKAVKHVLNSPADKVHVLGAQEVLQKAAVGLAAVSTLNAWRLKQLGFELD